MTEVEHAFAVSDVIALMVDHTCFRAIKKTQLAGKVVYSTPQHVGLEQWRRPQSRWSLQRCDRRRYFGLYACRGTADRGGVNERRCVPPQAESGRAERYRRQIRGRPVQHHGGGYLGTFPGARSRGQDAHQTELGDP